MFAAGARRASISMKNSGRLRSFREWRGFLAFSCIARKRRYDDAAGKRGFTLVELLVVIAIIGIDRSALAGRASRAKRPGEAGVRTT